MPPTTPNMPPQNSTPVNPTPGSVIPPAPPKHTPIGPIAGTVIIIAILVAGGLYYWGATLNMGEQNPPPFIPSNDTAVEGDLSSDPGAGLPSQSSSDAVSSIEADANAMDIGALESQNSAELNNI